MSDPMDHVGPTDDEELDAQLDTDPALASAVLEIEEYVAERGWDQQSRLFALVETARIVASDPDLAARMGLDGAAEEGSLTSVEQDELPPGEQLEDALQSIGWPAEVAGCVAVVERLVLPPEVDDEIPTDPAAAAEFAAQHPLRQEVRLVAGATRSGATYCALRMRAHDEEQNVVGGPDLVPELVQLVAGTLADEPQDEGVES